MDATIVTHGAVSVRLYRSLDFSTSPFDIPLEYFSLSSSSVIPQIRRFTVDSLDSLDIIASNLKFNYILLLRAVNKSKVI